MASMLIRPLLLIIITSLLVFSSDSPGHAQQAPDTHPDWVPDPAQRKVDSLLASRIPVLSVPADALARALPDSLDNSHFPWFPGILNQDGYMSCQQYCGPAYTFAYEINRLRQLDGSLPENRYAPHYTWNFYNKGINEGVNFLHSFHAMASQGHMTNADWGADTGRDLSGWVDGYEKYYRAMHNRISRVWAIPVNSAEGIQTVKQYLYDHLDGSASGGIVCFTASSPSMVGQGVTLPPGTPEEGKYVVSEWLPYPSHGMTLVGYHDSIRLDLNNDGQYSNTIDITGDGIVDARDWEIGGFRVANSYGSWWKDQGFFYVMYSAMALEFMEGGIWNHQVYTVEPDPDYSPLLTVQVDLEHNLRHQIRIQAGVSTNPDAQYPDHVIDFPLFNHQGGEHWMQGFDTLPELKRMEFGLDVTPLASFLHPGEAARFFLLVEERDPSNTGSGHLHAASFHWYGPTHEVFPCSGTDVPLHHYATTIAHTTGTVTFDPPVITTTTLPPFTPGTPYSVQLTASQGIPPYTFSLASSYTRSSSSIQYTPITASPVYPQTNYTPFDTVILPFPFPFYGKLYDTLFMNMTGMIHFSGDHLPYPYLMSPKDMLSHTAAIAPACQENLTIWVQDGDGMWVESCPDSVIFRWKLSLYGIEAQTNIEFNAVLYPDGSVLFAYGPIAVGDNQTPLWQGISAGDNLNHFISMLFPPEASSGFSYRFTPPVEPSGIALTPGGALTLMPTDSTIIYDITACVTDSRGISREKKWQLSDGLEITHTFASPTGFFTFNDPASLGIMVTSHSSQPIENLTITFACNTSAVTVTDGTETIPLIAPGETVSVEQAFALTINEILPDQTPVTGCFTLAFDGKERKRFITLTSAAPDIRLGIPVISDGVNQLLDLGETAHLMISVTNAGSMPSSGLQISLSGGDTALQILSPPQVNTAGIVQQETREIPFLVRASRMIQPGSEIPMLLEITNGTTISITMPFTLTIGSTSIALVSLSAITPSFPLMQHFLDSLGISYTTYDQMPPSLGTHPCAFLLLGTSSTSSHALNTTEALQLIQYLDNGGRAYMECYASWHFGVAPMIEPYFRISTERNGVYYFNEAFGVPGTFTEGMEFLYPGPSPFAIFTITPKEDGIALLTNDDTIAKTLTFGYDGEAYKTIGSLIELGYLYDGTPPSEKARLIREYIDFFGINFEGPFPFFHADTTHTCQWHPVQFTDDSFDHILTWQWEFPGGTPAWSTEQHPVVTYAQQGIYDVILTVSDGIRSETMHKKSYMHIRVCAGVEDPLPASPKKVSVFPNPASGNLHILFSEKSASGAMIQLVDMHGKIHVHQSLPPLMPQEQVILDVSGVPQGLYGIRVLTPDAVLTTKVVIVR